MKKRLTAVILAMSMAAAALAGCGSKAEAPAPGADTEQTEEPTAENTDDAAEPAPAEETKDGPTIQMIVMSINSEYWLNVQAGSLAELEKSGGELIYTGPSQDGDIQGQMDLMENAISSGVDGIILIPVDSDALVPSVEKAEDAGIPVVVVDGPVNTDKVTSYICHIQ